jgi:hypothetical protein
MVINDFKIAVNNNCLETITIVSKIK